MLSMTGYGCACAEKDGRKLQAEIKSVNHRFLDIAPHYPRVLLFAEDRMKRLISARLKRGHVDLYLSYENTREDAKKVIPDLALAESYRQAVTQICEAGGIENHADGAFYAGLPEVLRVEAAQDDQEALLSLVDEAVNAALDALIVMRQREGACMEADLKEKLASVRAEKDEIAKLAPQAALEYRNRLRKRLDEAGRGTADPYILAQETAAFAEKAAIDEELARLDSHLKQMEILMEQEECGKKMDFLIQEMNREFNTIASKAQDAAIAAHVVNAKSAVEKLREQVQNIE